MAVIRTRYTRRLDSTDRSIERIEARKCRSPLLTRNIGTRHTVLIRKGLTYKPTIIGPLYNLGA